MGKYKWSSYNNAFFPVSLLENYLATGWNLEDATDINDEVAEAFMMQPKQGMERGSDKDGLPVWVASPEPTKDEIIEISKMNIKNLKDQANEIINSNQWPSKLALGRLGDTDKIKFNAWLDYIDALEALDAENALNLVYPKRPDEDG
ncbi:tail fiber assembly protein [Erwinia rhapontici]|uniref:tail fiber assembly protein n=1 Tax=Erwinia rhapontici TaxID=55212 RepID=UPI003D36EFA2